MTYIYNLYIIYTPFETNIIYINNVFVEFVTKYIIFNTIKLNKNIIYGKLNI